VWQPDLVGKIHAYPKTLEEHQKKVDLMRTQIRLYNAEGITGRSGVPDGWAGKKKLIKEINDKARLAAQEILDDMLVTARFVPDNAESQLAMRGALAMIVAEKFTPETETVPLYSADTRLKAMNLVLKFAQRAPTTSSVVTETTAEDFLKVLAKR
jgi:hypothetical protein